ncbi:hypothetical protein PAHAL_5G067300 [Panicum hallii]|uniref:Hpc2-related domain-containing protein n=1 Tax=Panicum hallii TaxID=206008 RepID=A0A2S3HPC2_9POAL|nr:ubinuclein-1 isoform X2 [Panicum hallii]PAN27220.1 hypothetical protein PAHAL_5G067300 [Panicum hallii]
MEDPVAATAPAAAAARVPAAAAPAAAAAPPALAPQQPPATAAAVPEAAAACRRQLFTVELRPGETTIVSWKKLLREAGQAAPAPAVAAEPAFPAHAGPSGAAHPAENDPKDPTQPNRFNAVIEKIERLYMGKHSSDEEDLDDVPDDDQYDTEDSFIDDAELDEYFEVDNLKTKHDGYFVNKGKLEQIDPGASANVAPKKRRRKDSASTYPETNQHAPVDYFNIGDVPGKSSGRGTVHPVKQLASSTVGSYGQYHEDNRVVKNKTSGPGGAPKRKSSDFSVVADATEHAKISKDASHAPLELRELEKHKAAVLPVDYAHKSKTSETYDYAYSAYRDKGTSVQLDFQLRKASGENQDPSNRIYRKEKYGTSEYPVMAMGSAVYSTQTVNPVVGREGSGTKPKGTRLERAIRDLQKIVAEYRPPIIDINEVDPNGQAAVKRRLPQEVKQKLAKVARLSANQGKIQEHELMDRLMGIVGHLVQRRTLKRNMKEMVESGLSAKLEKADRFQRIKMEINEMIKTRVAAKSKVNEQQDGSADDFQVANDERRALKGKSVMDAALEDRICDLYDLYVEGMDEDKGPQSRKLYVELAELWPQGYMDNVGIKDAISRSKDRKRLLYNQQKVRNEERMKRKRLAASAKLQEGYPVVMQGGVVPQVAQPPITNPITYPAPDYGQNQGLKSYERVRETSSSAIPDDSIRNAGEMKKKKRKPEYDAVDTQANIPKAPLQHGNEKQKPSKPLDEANAGSQLTQTVLGLPTVLGHNQQPS